MKLRPGGRCDRGGGVLGLGLGGRPSISMFGSRVRL